MAKVLILDITESFSTIFFHTWHIIGTINFYILCHFYVTLTLAKGHRISEKQNLASDFCDTVKFLILK